MNSGTNTSSHHHHHHHHHHSDDASKFKNHTLTLAKRRKMIARAIYTLLCISAAIVVVLCILSFFVEY